MASDPAFLFYPGDYLRDTQCLSEKSQVAYDRIMCEHMRNICISQQQLKFFTKRLSEDEVDELMMVLTQIEPGKFQISWIAESIEKRRKYSDSRRKNRQKKDDKPKKDMKNISKTYDEHMENEIENVNENKSEEEIESEKLKKDERENYFMHDSEVKLPFDDSEFIQEWKNWIDYRKETRKTIRGKKSAQGQLDEIKKLSGGRPDIAILVIKQSIQKGWQGLFGIKDAQPEKLYDPTGRRYAGDADFKFE